MYILLAIATGTITVVSRVVNAALATRIGSLRGSFVNHIVGALFAGLLLLVGVRTGVLRWSGIPLMYFFGGSLGVLIVAASNYAVQHAGTVVFAVLLLAFQLLSSACIDHFGWMGGDVISMTFTRGAGLALIIGGAVLVVTDRAARRPADAASAPRGSSGGIKR
jgi:transporter family-2 protein